MRSSSTVLDEIELNGFLERKNIRVVETEVGRFISNELAWEMVQVFLHTDFEGGRHLRRIEKIEPIKNNDNE